MSGSGVRNNCQISGCIYLLANTPVETVPDDLLIYITSLWQSKFFFTVSLHKCTDDRYDCQHIGVASSRTPYGMQRTSISGFRAVFLAPCSSGLSIGQPIPPVLRERISFAATAVKFHVSANHASLSYPASLLPSMVS